MILTLEVQTLICPTEKVVGVKGGIQSESLQTNRMEVQDPLKWSQKLEAKTASLMPSREASVHHSKVSLIGDIQDPERVDQGHEQVSEIVRNPL